MALRLKTQFAGTVSGTGAQELKSWTEVMLS